MYRYDEFDAAIVKDRVRQFRGQVARRLSGELTEDQFKPLRLMNGLYLQLHAYMLRVAVPYGVLSSRQLRRLAHVARAYDKGYAHVTTRQNVQFNWPALIDAPAILDALADVEMHAIQTSGNCIRNVTTDQYAGAASDELEDPRVWCEVIRQWSTFHPEFSFLPRKFKIAVTAATRDRAAIAVHDIGLRLIERDGDVGFQVLVGGGLGRTPFIGLQIKEFLPRQSLLSYLEAILRVYNLAGRRDNKYKARIKILVDALGIDAFREKVEAEWAEINGDGIDLPQAEVDRIKAYFAPPAFEALPDDDAGVESLAASDPRFAQWLAVNVANHKAPGYRIVNISLKDPDAPPGDISADQMDAVAKLAEQYSFDEARTTHEQNLVLPHVALRDLPKVWRGLDAAGLSQSNVDLASDIIACPGLDYCSLANTRSIPIAQRIARDVRAVGDENELGEIGIKISGCINACGHHHVGHIGILGVDKKGEEFYQILLGGSASDDASLGTISGRALSADETVAAVRRIFNRYKEERNDGERFIDAYRRLGDKPFKEAIYGDVQA
ncbi:MAG: nitrite/sulfite reductase [Alphaproteobacteria bacterium]|nr:nitrite/sulfite reductase [Alphaproteobacteria bacterium]